jgi:ribosomal protein L11 methyltransferase
LPDDLPPAHEKEVEMIEAWAEVTCHAPPAAVDLLSTYLVELSGVGVCTGNREVDTFSLDGLDDGGEAVINSYFPDDDTLSLQVERITAYLEELAAANPGWSFAPPQVTLVRQEEWANSWKEYFKPFRVGERLVVKPTWEVYEVRDGDLILEIDPGMAFGTGSHETTKLCLEAMEGIFGRSGEFAGLTYLAPASCLDVGTGSGILGIGALKLGISSVVGIDIDPEAVKVAAENAALNGVADRMTVSTTPLERVAGTFPLVVANILAEDLARMASLLEERVAPGGFLILSGILTVKEPLVMEGFSPFDLTLLPAARDGEWSCLVYLRTT